MLGTALHCSCRSLPRLQYRLQDVVGSDREIETDAGPSPDPEASALVSTHEEGSHVVGKKTDYKAAATSRHLRHSQHWSDTYFRAKERSSGVPGQ